jgi:hypothetical protein
MFKNKKELIGMDLVLDLVTTELSDKQPGTPEYDKVLEQLERVNKIANSQKSDPVSKDGVLAVVANLAGISLILSHERLHVITTKALGFVRTLR